MNLKDIKSQFPIFKSNKNLIYFDTANSAQNPIQVINALEDLDRKSTRLNSSHT